MKLSIGTAQFGMDYGISNYEGKASNKEAERIIGLAREAGISSIDTAIIYGDSEEILGEIGIEGFNVTTKLPKVDFKDNEICDWIKKQIYGSLSRLKIDKVDNLLLHNCNDLIGSHGKEIYKTLSNLKKKGIINKIGISAYNPNEIEEIINNYDIDIVQAPLNLLDKRLLSSGCLSKLKKKSIEVHTRSCFLQGLLLMDRDEIPEYFINWGTILNLWHQWLIENKASPIKTCLSFPFSIKEIDKIVVGVNSYDNLKEIIKNIPLLDLQYPNISSDDEFLINPSKWKM